MRSGRLTMAVVVAAVLIILFLSACGSSSSSSSSSTTAQSQARVNLAKCLRGQGVDVPDPSSSGPPATAAEMRRLAQKYSPIQLNRPQPLVKRG